MNVELIAYTPDPEAAVAAAARLCYSDCGAADLKKGMSREEMTSLLKRLISMGHLSPAEHASFTFAIDGVSRSLSHQLVRHRIASYSQKSQRYVSESNFFYITPPSIAEDPEATAVFEQVMGDLQEAYGKLADIVPREDARYLLPNAVETKLVCTMNARSLYNFFRMRCCCRAQWEIRALAQEMREIVRQIAPDLFALAGPSCETEGICWEGKFSCGRAREVRFRGADR
ncbi:MAG: FAD-dependent thymidylate synthase [Syntrophaceticus sp.]|nr:FAD-dependent thymidylate synthase [Syntrophaceticus sp.]MDD3314681.1 FAD-dependent thymidylate synthase [Syntrophaceticus sp.]MDD4360425.1 FAD-dependent thymidylate synthase [Syntrophaceticus sp.]MDD4783179.1 FAD-dependent thymidylate synthase [Syntrophaceticus sp.]HBG21865.1 FAD-dependent thymidylate synthase [Peptococcaceae bacterium]